MLTNQSPIPDSRDNISSELHKSVFRGDDVHFESPLFKRWVQSGSPAIFPENVTIEFEDTVFSDPAVGAEAERISRACFFPIRVTNENTAPDRTFVCRIPSGIFFRSIHRFALVIMKEMKRMSDNGISQLTISDGIRILQTKPEIGRSETLKAPPDAIKEEVCFIDPKEGRGETYRRVQSEVQNVLSYFEKNVFVFNTEKLLLQNFGFLPEHLLFPCAGLKPFAVLRSIAGEETVRKCTFLEKNPRAIEYLKTFLSCENSEQIFDLQHHTMKSQQFLPANGQEFVQSLMKKALDEGFSGKSDELLKQMIRMRTLSSFQCLDYLKDHDRILSFLNPSEKTLFWHSNAWESHYALFFLSQGELRKNYLSFAGRLGDFYQMPVWVHKEAYEIIIGEDFYSPVAVCTAGGEKSGKPKISSFLPLKDFHL